MPSKLLLQESWHRKGNMSMKDTVKSLDSLQPEEIVSKYYTSVNSGDLESVKSLMTEESYYHDIRIFRR